MRVEFKTEGGFAYFPGLNQPVTIDTGELFAQEADELERLMEAARFFDLPETSAPRRGVADGRRYTISVSSPEHSHAVHVDDPIEDANIQALVDFLGAKIRMPRGAGD
ncbi:MAG: hypothetical protein M3338_06655 [Actinomycetota bacterium]|nr:hypothetical protein [Actinomycetota bacterium]